LPHKEAHSLNSEDEHAHFVESSVEGKDVDVGEGGIEPIRVIWIRTTYPQTSNPNTNAVNATACNKPCMHESTMLTNSVICYEEP
jgi:hypothetical protein